jgi:SAM-dependent methyltransferase
MKSRVLDVGCGSGALLYEMRELLGIKALTGVDTFIASDICYENGVKVIKAELGDISDQFDTIMLHHSLEHMPDQLSVLSHLRRLLRPKGTVLIRIPVCSSFAWKTYGVHWAQLDAPRHLFIHSVSSFRILTEQAGFKIRETIYDSNVFQFWASEQYKLGISLTADNSYGINPENSIFTKRQIDEFAKLAEELNERGNGDQAGFFLEAV